MDLKPNPRLILRALRKKQNVQLEIQKSQDLLRSRAVGNVDGVPSEAYPNLGAERSGEIGNHKVNLQSIRR